MKAIIRLDVPEWQIGQPVHIFFKDTMEKHSVCEEDIVRCKDLKTSTTHDDFFDWLACAVVMDSEWDDNPGFYREVICRKLVRLGVLELKGDEYYLPEPKRT